jgi:cytochrome c oxidase subunit 4
MSEHVVPLRVYYLIFAALMVGTYITVQAAFIDLGALNTIVALTIACAKAVLVVLFFMHVKYSTRLTWVVVVGSVFWLGILLALTFSDYLTRSWRTFG